MANYRIALDAMGGDNAPSAVVEGAKLARQAFSDVRILLYGPEEVLKPLVEGEDGIEVVHAPDVIGMHDAPMLAVRKMTESSMVKAVMAVRAGEADAVVSAGSTGALLAGGMLRIGRISGIERPALAPVIPGRKKPFLLIDCGANVDCQPKYLQQFGLMGSVYMESVLGVKDPEVGLVNIGSEAEKGDRLTKEAFELMSAQTSYRFVGNAEARDVPNGDFDVVVADGFVGNVILKITEGVAKLILGMLKDSVRTSRRTKVGALLMKPALYRLRDSMDYTSYGGAPLLGVNGAVVKAHGSSDAKAILNAVRQARGMLEGNVVGKIRDGLRGLSEEN
ncbi:MAG: Phosphate acyltransferase [Firmicutes bacterium ADurb.Bin467]|nr:MAG: Phosphate acyltransferase [Firmicutes bacterium ADurb.Bin467]